MVDHADHNGYPYPGPNKTDAPRLMVPGAITLVIAWILYLGRVYTRLRPVNTLGWDDYTVSGGIILATVATIIAGISCYFGLGRRSYYVGYEDGTKANHYSFIGQPFVVWAICLAKCSVAFMLLRIKRTKGWQIFLYIVIAIQVASAAAANIAQLIQCRPMSAYWNVTVATDPATKCWSAKDIQASAYVNAAISIATDIVFSLLPIIFLRKLNRPIREKLVLGLLMALGMVATLASIFKVTLLYHYRNTKDPFWDVIPLSLWWQLEQNISIIASCIPTLKSLFEKTLRRVGLLSTHSGLTRSSKGYIEYGGNSDVQMGSVNTTVKRGVFPDIDDDTQSEQHILHTEISADRTSQSLNQGISKTTEVSSSVEKIEEDLEWNSPSRTKELMWR